MCPDFVVAEGVVRKRVLKEMLEEAHVPRAYRVSYEALDNLFQP